MSEINHIKIYKVSSDHGFYAVFFSSKDEADYYCSTFSGSSGMEVEEIIVLSKGQIIEQDTPPAEVIRKLAALGHRVAFVEDELEY